MQCTASHILFVSNFTIFLSNGNLRCLCTQCMYSVFVKCRSWRQPLVACMHNCRYVDWRFPRNRRRAVFVTARCGFRFFFGLRFLFGTIWDSKGVRERASVKLLRHNYVSFSREVGWVLKFCKLFRRLAHISSSVCDTVGARSLSGRALHCPYPPNGLSLSPDLPWD